MWLMHRLMLLTNLIMWYAMGNICFSFKGNNRLVETPDVDTFLTFLSPFPLGFPRPLQLEFPVTKKGSTAFLSTALLWLPPLRMLSSASLLATERYWLKPNLCNIRYVAISRLCPGFCIPPVYFSFFSKSCFIAIPIISNTVTQIS